MNIMVSRINNVINSIIRLQYFYSINYVDYKYFLLTLSVYARDNRTYIIIGTK